MWGLHPGSLYVSPLLLVLTLVALIQLCDFQTLAAPCIGQITHLSLTQLRTVHLDLKMASLVSCPAAVAR